MAARLERFATGVAAVAIAAGIAAPSAGAASGPAVKPVQELAMLVTSHKVFAAPKTHPRRVGSVRAWRPITGAQTVLPVVGHANRAGVHWLRILVPGRPNGGSGWIAQRGTTLTTTSWSIVVRTSRRRAYVYRHGKLVRSLRAIVGKPSTPTPHGRFFVEESVRMLSGAAGGPFALALSARSNVLQEFDGGPGQIAMHGLANLGGTLGTAISHGCVRLSNRSIGWLVARVGAGTPVAIRN
jgi:lipoprotein-anchoring transpeptidase ErfK/SrfK